MRRTTSDLDRIKIVEAYKRGEAIKAIAYRFNTSDQNVCQIAKRRGAVHGEWLEGEDAVNTLVK
jgi:hypothetical protein